MNGEVKQGAEEEEEEDLITCLNACAARVAVTVAVT